MRKILLALFMLVMGIAAGPAYADCTSPNSPEGGIEYFSGVGIRYCNGTNWLDVGVSDNLGNHTATTNLNMDSNNITNVGTISATTLSGAHSGNGSSLTNLNASALASGTVPPARLGSGTANNTRFLRGDSTWQAITSSQWSNNGSLIYYNSGNVGIGRNDPQYPLDVVGLSRFGVGASGNALIGNDGGNVFIELRESDNNGTPFIDFTNDSATDFDVRIVLQNDDQLALQGGELAILDGGAAGTPLLRIGDDSFLTDVDQANTLGVYGAQDSTRANLRLGSGGPTLSGASGTLSVGGVIHSTSGGIRFPDGTTQTTAASGGGSLQCTTVTASSGSTVANCPGGGYVITGCAGQASQPYFSGNSCRSPVGATALQARCCRIQ